MGVSDIFKTPHGAATHGSHVEGLQGYRCFCPPEMLNSHDSFDKKPEATGNIVTRGWDNFTGWLKSLWEGAISFPKSLWDSATGRSHNVHPRLEPHVAKQLFCVPQFEGVPAIPLELNPFLPGYRPPPIYLGPPHYEYHSKYASPRKSSESPKKSDETEKSKTLEKEKTKSEGSEKKELKEPECQDLPEGTC